MTRIPIIERTYRKGFETNENTSPVLVLQQQLVQLLCLCTTVQIVSLLQNLLCRDTTHANKNIYNR